MTKIEEYARDYPTGYRDLRLLPDDRAVWIQPKLFTYAICIGGQNGDGIDSHWCYETLEVATIALAVWNPATQEEPQGWIRHPASGRRRENGDAAKQIIRK